MYFGHCTRKAAIVQVLPKLCPLQQGRPGSVEQNLQSQKSSCGWPGEDWLGLLQSLILRTNQGKPHTACAGSSSCCSAQPQWARNTLPCTALLRAFLAFFRTQLISTFLAVQLQPWREKLQVHKFWVPRKSLEPFQRSVLLTLLNILLKTMARTLSPLKNKQINKKSNPKKQT